jgi:hypothetical protein
MIKGSFDQSARLEIWAGDVDDAVELLFIDSQNSAITLHVVRALLNKSTSWIDTESYAYYDWVFALIYSHAVLITTSVIFSRIGAYLPRLRCTREPFQPHNKWKPVDSSTSDKTRLYAGRRLLYLEGMGIQNLG